MANTTNYNWETPDDTDLVKDGALAIRTLGSAVDTTVFNNASAAIAKSIVDAKGDIIAATAADTVSRLAVGANNTVLTADSSTATGLKWAAPAGGGKVLQVVAATYSTQTANSTDVYADTGLTATITPSSATSKIAVFASQSGCRKSDGNATNQILLRLMRGTNQIALTYGLYTNTLLDNADGSITLFKLDEPATTSATTYKTQFKNFFNGASVTVQNASSDSTIILMEIGA